MRFNAYQTRAALGITRTATADGRSIYLGGFGALPQGDALGPDHESNVTANTPCQKVEKGLFGGGSSWSAYCGCMYGETDRISQPTAERQGGAWNFATGSSRWACQTAAEWNLKPWSCEGIIATLVGSGGKADPLRHMSGTLTTGAKGAEYKRCAAQTVEKLQQFIPGIRSQLQALGLIAPDAGQDPGTGTTPIQDPSNYKNALMAMTDSELVSKPKDEFVVAEILYRSQNGCGAGRARQMAGTYAEDGRPACKVSRIDYIGGALPTLPPVVMPRKDEAKEGLPTGLLLGGAAVAVAAIFLLKK